MLAIRWLTRLGSSDYYPEFQSEGQEKIYPFMITCDLWKSKCAEVGFVLPVPFKTSSS
jgi:hypothetical protein